MTVSDEDLARAREEGRRRRKRLSSAQRARRELAGVVDTGNLSDEDVLALLGSFRAGMNEDDVEQQAR